MEQSPNNTYQAIALLEEYFSHQKAMLYRHINLRFSQFFANLQRALHLNNCNLLTNNLIGLKF